MYLKDKKTVSIGSIVVYSKFKDVLEIKRITITGRFLLHSITYDTIAYSMDRDFTVRGTNNKILFKLELVKKIKFKRKRYKNG